MAGADRTAAVDLIAGRLREEARLYSFFQLVQLLQDRLAEGSEVGARLTSKDESLLFEVSNDLGFPTSDVVSVRPMWKGDQDSDEFGRFRVRVAFLGLHGSSSPLPGYYVEQIASYDPDESVLKGFLDFFHHRLIGLLHRGWRKYRYYARYQRGGEDDFSKWTYALFGLRDDAVRASMQLYWPRLLRFAGVLSTRNRSPAVLSTVIAYMFGLERVEVREWIPRKVWIDDAQTWRLGSTRSHIGSQTVLGDRAPDRQGKIRIVLYGLDYERFSDFLPRGKDYRRLRNLIEFMLRDQLAYDFELHLAEGQARPMTLKKTERARLGWSQFVGDKRAREARQVLIPGRV
jgi:type VI secretion system protein ImpH